MDERLENLARLARGAPDDAEAAGRYDRALLRAGQRDAVRARYRFKFLCPARWEELRDGDHPEVRRCDRCSRAVHFVRSAADLVDCVQRGRCVAVQAGELERGLEGLLEAPRVNSAHEPGRPCLVEAAEDPLELEHLLLGEVALGRPDEDELARELGLADEVAGGDDPRARSPEVRPEDRA